MISRRASEAADVHAVIDGRDCFSINVYKSNRMRTKLILLHAQISRRAGDAAADVHAVIYGWNYPT